MNLPIIVANWKMQFSYVQAMHYIQNYAEELALLGRLNKRKIILCPPFEALHLIAQIISSNSILEFGGQDCSAHQLGPYTGQVSALSLAQLGCSYCIVGHSERRNEYNETSGLIAQKVMRLLENDITPIVCIGENEQAYHSGRTYDALEEQLGSLMEVIPKNSSIYYAYEPVWAIGKDIVPDAVYLQHVITWLTNRISVYSDSFKLLYGGGVTTSLLPLLAKIEGLNGVLVGSASVDFQKFKNIVSWSK